MATLTTYNNQIKTVQKIAIEEWAKLGGDYVTNAFDHELKAHGHSYQIYVTKGDNGNWFVAAEEHDIEDIDQPKEGFKLLRDAKYHATEFAYFFLNCWLDNNESN